MVNKKILFVLVALSCYQCTCYGQNNGPLPNLVGRWIEDEAARTGLNDFLWARGVNWFKRKYATVTSWRYEQNIVYRNGGYEVNGIKGPLREVFSYKLTPDNRTVEMIDLGDSLGGERQTLVAVVGNALVSYLSVPGGDVDMIATRSFDSSNPNVMYYKTKDVPYGYEMVATMKRQQ